jgi:hypothetical protein
MESTTKYIDKTVFKACGVLSGTIETDEDFEADDMIRRLTEMLALWAARMVDEKVCDDHLALARLVAEAMVVQFHMDRGELLPE